MAPQRTPPEDAIRDLTKIVLRSGATLAVGGAATIVLLIAPIAVWVHYGQHPQYCAAVTIGSLLLCVVVLRTTMRRYTRLWHRDPPLLQAASTPASCRSQDLSRSMLARDRRDPSTRPCGPSRCRPRYIARGPRDAGCATATPQLARRSTRRRTRP
jgi:hypothetical protein